MPSLYAVLAYLGTLPFIFISIALLFGVREIAYLGALNIVIATYGLVIVSFMAGTHWGLYINQGVKPKANLLLTSNVIALAAWFSFLTAPTIITLWIYALSFALLLYLDSKLARDHVISRDYFRIRSFVSLVVITSLVLTMIVL